MIKSLILILATGITSLIYTDLSDSNILFSVILPIVDFFCFVSLGVWFVILFHKNGITQTSSSSGDSGGGFNDFDGGGD